MRSTPALAAAALLVTMGMAGPSPARAQTRVATLDELRRELAPGDLVTVVPAAGPAVSGRLLRVGDVDLELRTSDKRLAPPGTPRDVTLALQTIRLLERPPDSARNGARIGAGIGAGLAGGMFLYALAIDRNEVDEWAPFYLKGAVMCTGVGALIGWAIDKSRSKPHIRFEAAEGRTGVSLLPVVSRGRGIGVAVSVSSKAGLTRLLKMP